MTERVLEPEWLDELPDDEPRAVASRRDLRRLNVFMNHAGLIARALRNIPRPERILDIGAGDGSFTLRFIKTAGWKNIDVALLDRAATIPATVREGFRALGCNLAAVQSDVLQGFGQIGTVDCVMHLASLASPKDYLDHPIETLESGSTGTRNMLNLALLHKATFLLTSTSECYGDPLEHPQRETYWGNVNPVGLRSCYDESKRYA